VEPNEDCPYFYMIHLFGLLMDPIMLLLFRDGTIVSGDSLGHVQFWDPEFGTLKESFSSHEADILTMAISKDETTLYVSGVDNKIAQLKEIHDSTTKKTKWIVIGGRRIHTHDVRSLTISPNSTGDPLLASGGVDTTVYVMSASNFLNAPLRKIPPFPPWSIISLATEKNWLFYHLTHHIHLWRLGHARRKRKKFPDSESSTRLDVNVQPIKLLDLSLKVTPATCFRGKHPDRSLCLRNMLLF
jgi:U3 small nucleolar RNA-associated protein 4